MSEERDQLLGLIEDMDRGRRAPGRCALCDGMVTMDGLMLNLGHKDGCAVRETLERYRDQKPLEACCDEEDRGMNGGCNSCADPPY